jgi:endo-alpha-1,4-polygalactosaminidase (GH114 family)
MPGAGRGDCLRPSWFGAVSASGELLSAFWTGEWHAILKGRMDELLEREYDGVFLDDLLHYFNWWSDPRLLAIAAQRGGPSTAEEAAQAMIRLVVELATYARQDAPRANPSFRLVVNGAPYIGFDAGADEAASGFLDYVDAIDGILLESSLGRDNTDALLAVLRDHFVSRRVAVLTIEFPVEDPAGRDPEVFACAMDDVARRNGLTLYIAGDHKFDRLYPPIAADTSGDVACRRSDEG